MERRHDHSASAQEEGPDWVRKLSRHFARGTRWQGSPQRSRQSPLQLLRTGRYLTTGAVRLHGRRLIDMILVVLRLHQLSRNKSTPLFMFSSTSPRRTYDCQPDSLVDRARSVRRTPNKMLAALRQLHDGVRARIRTDGGEYSDGFGVEQGLR